MLLELLIPISAAALTWHRDSCLCSYEQDPEGESSRRRTDQRHRDSSPCSLSATLLTFHPSNLRTSARANLLTSLKSALPQNPPLTPLQSTLTNLKNLNSFRIRTYAKEGEGVLRLTNSTFAAIAVFVVVFLLLSIRTAFGQSSSTKTLGPAPHPARASTENSNPVDASLAQAKSLADKGTPHDAEPLVRRYLAAHPDSGDAHFLLGYILFREIQDQAAPTRSASDTRYVEKTAEHVGAAFKIKNARASLAEYTEGAKYHVPSAFDLKIVSFDYVLLDDYSDADKWLTKMLEWTPNDPEGWYYLGRTKYNENRFDEALRAFQQSLKLDPHNVKTEDNLGLSYAGLNRTDDAIAAYQTAIAWQNEAAAKNPGPFINMASLLLDQNRTAESVTYLKQAIEISPDDSKPHELLGKAYSRLDQLPQAQSELEKAIEFAPQNPNLPCMLGPLYRKQGLLDKAKLELDRCAALNGTHSSPETPRP